MDEDLEIVETSDIEELEEWNELEPIRISRTRSPSPGDGSILHPLKRIKLSHDRDASAVAVPYTPLKRVQAGSVPETPEMRRLSQSPSLSQSSATVTVDHPTSQTNVADSPGAKVADSNVVRAQEEPQSPAPLDQSQGQIYPDSPLQRVQDESTPPQSPYPTDLPSPFLFTTTPLCTPVKARKVVNAHNLDKAPIFGTPIRSLELSPQVIEFVQTADDGNDVLMEDHGPGTESLFSSPAKSVKEESVGSPHALSGFSPRSMGASSPVNPSRSPSPSSPPPSQSERSSVQAEPLDEEDAPEDEEPVLPQPPEEPPIIPPEKPYALRKRTAVQKNPYTVLDSEYWRQTKEHKDARLKYRSPSRGHRRHSEGRDMAEVDEEDRGFIVDDNEELSDGETRRRGRRRTLDREDGGRAREHSAAGDPSLERTGDASEDEEAQNRKELESFLDSINDEPEDQEERRKRRRKRKEERRKEKEQRKAVKNRTEVSRADKTMHEAEDSTDRPDRQSTSAAESDRTAHGHKQAFKDEHAVNSRPTASLQGQQDETLSISSDSDAEVVSRRRTPRRSLKRRSPSTARSVSPVVSVHSDSSSNSMSGLKIKLANGKVVRAALLFKLYPAGLARKLLRQAQEKQRIKSRRAEASRAEGSDPLRPGQTRVRRNKDLAQREIKGDSESELEMPEDDDRRRTPSPSPTRSPSPLSQQRPAASKKRTFDSKPRGSKAKKAEYESDSDSDVEVISGAAIKSLTTQKKATIADRPKTEVTLIDYMLATTLDFNIRERTRKKKRSKKSAHSKPKLDIVIAGARGDPGKQTLLSNYQGYGRNRTQGSKHSRQSSAAGRAVTPTVNASDEEDGSSDSEGSEEDNQHEENVRSHQEREGGGSNGSTRRQGVKKTKPRLRDLYILKPPGGGKATIVTGARRKMVTVSVEVEALSDDGLHPQPKIRQWKGDTYRRVRPPACRLPVSLKQAPTEGQSATALQRLEADRHPSVPREPEDELEDSQWVRYPFFRESGVPRLPSGIAFAFGTYINKGWLWELLSCINPAPDSDPPGRPSSFLQRFDLPIEASVDEIAQVVDNTLDGIFDFINDPPEAMPEPTSDQQMTIDQWTLISRNLCKGVSFCLSERSDGDRSSLINRVGNAVRVLVSRVEGLRLPHRSLDIRVFLANWTAVELAVRIGEPMTKNGRLTASILTDSIQLLVNQLLFFGLDSTMKAVIRGMDPEALSKYSLPGHTAELWVRLIHLCCEYDKREMMKHNHAFWQFVQVSFKASLDAMTPDVGVYEDLWHSIFSLCAISQFTVHGMVRDTVNLPGCWELVRFICDQAFHPDGSEPVNHNAYVDLLLDRFLILNERWKWKVVDVSPLVKLVVDTVFHPIKFGNLEGEKPEYPDFLREPDASDLSSWSSSDPAYVLLLKFIYKAAQEPTVKEPAIKKMLSLAEPAASIHFDQNSPLRVEDMDKIINPVTAAIVAVRLVSTKEYFANKVEQIRSAISFAEANNNTRMVLIRGLRYWSEFVLKHQPHLGIDPLAPWLGDMADTLAKEWAKWKKKHKGVKPDDDDELSVQAKSLLEAVHKACILSPVPQSDYLARVKQFIVVTREEDEIQLCARLVLDNVVNRWYQVHPPLRPLPPKQDQEESQDYDDAFDDINWDAADIPEELRGPPSASQVQGQDQIDKSMQALKDAIDERLQWFLFRSFKDCFKAERIELGCSFISVWVGCKLLGTHEGTIKKDIDEMLGILSTGKFSDWDKKIVETAFALAILQRYPMAYTNVDCQDRFREALLWSLTSPESVDDLAAAYVRAFLSVDYLQHPLIRGCQSVPPPSGDPPVYNFNTKDFPQIRINMLDTMLSNVNSLVEGGCPDGERYSAIVAESFSAMRQILLNWSDDEDDLAGKATYAAFCKEVAGLLPKYTTLAGRPDMEFWVKWTP